MVLRFLEPRLPHSCMDCFEETECIVSITVVGESGDLAKKKIFPALFVLYYYGCLPKHFTIFGYARSKMTDAELRTMVSYVKTFAELTRGRIVVKGWTNFLKDVSTTQISVIHRINLHSWTRNYRNMRVEEFLTACSIYLFLQTYS